MTYRLIQLSSGRSSLRPPLLAIGIRLNGLYIIPVLALLILIHEIGHFVTARMCGVTVEEFGIGIPPRLFGWKRNGVIWSINAIPFGGFVRVKGEDGKDMDPGSMNTKGPWQRGFFLAAGSGMNLILAVVLMILLIGIQGVPTENLYIDYVEPNSPAGQAGWHSGDRVVEAGGVDIENQDDLSGVTRDFYGKPMSVVLDRGGTRVESMVTPRKDPPEGQGAVGIHLYGDGSEVPDAIVSIRDVIPGSAAATAGLQNDDEFVSINNIPITNAYVALSALRNAQGTTIPIEVKGADGQVRQLSLAVPELGIEVTEVDSGSPAGEAGLVPNDRLVEIDSKPLTSFGELIDAVRSAQGDPIPVAYLRDGQRHETSITVPEIGPNSTYNDAAESVGVNLHIVDVFTGAGFNEHISPKYDKVPASQIIPRGFSEAYDRTKAMVSSIWELITNRDLWDQVAGPIGMGQITGEALDRSPLPTWVVLTNITILLSLNLAALNLLPLPALDGGRLLFVVIEILRGGRKIAPEKEGVVHLVGFVLLIGLMFVIAFSDVNRIIDGRSFLP